MPQPLTVALQAVAGLGCLVLGAEMLVRGASALALRLGISALAVGLTVVAFGTSTPELVVSLRATLAGAEDIAVGNVVGSNICNIALILGLSALVRPARVEAKIFRLDVPLLVAVSLVLVAALAGGLTRVEGGLLVLGLAVYTAATVWLARREVAAVRSEFADALEPPKLGLAGSALLVVGGLALLVAGGDLLVRSAIVMATAAGVSQAVIGLTVVALGTSLPELATSVVAAARGQADLAVGNVVGSNLFNILGILGATALVRPVTAGGITGVDLLVMTALAMLLLPIVRTGFRVSRLEGVVLVAIYVAYVGWLVWRA